MVDLSPKLTLLVIQTFQRWTLVTLEELVREISKASIHFDTEYKIVIKVNPLFGPKKSMCNLLHGRVKYVHGCVGASDAASATTAHVLHCLHIASTSDSMLGYVTTS